MRVVVDGDGGHARTIANAVPSGSMSEVVKINAIAVPPGMGPELERRFAERARSVEQMPGFRGFELLRPVGGETRYFVYTRWESEEAFQNWVGSQAFQHGHARAQSDDGRPVAQGADLLSFEVVQHIDAPRPAS
jgi:heme-degrading monooxygenase HmoA